MHHEEGQNFIPLLLSIPSGCEWERKRGVTVCVRMITFPFGEPFGMWNRLGCSEAVNAADHAQRAGEHPKALGLPDFRVRPGISRKPWMGSLGSWRRKRAFLYFPLFKREIFFPLLWEVGHMHSQNLLTLLNLPNSGRETLASASSRRVSLKSTLGPGVPWLGKQIQALTLKW